MEGSFKHFQERRLIDEVAQRDIRAELNGQKRSERNQTSGDFLQRLHFLDNQTQDTKRKHKREALPTKKEIRKNLVSFGLATVAYLVMPNPKEKDDGASKQEVASQTLEEAEAEDTFTPDAETRELLKGAVIVIDAGHGGADPGAHGTFQGKPVYEAPYTLDVAERLQEIVEEAGGTAIMTRENVDNPHPVSTVPYEILPLVKNDRFTSNNKIAYAKKAGIEARLETVRDVIREYPGKRVVVVSIHFDSLGEGNKNIKGMSVWVPKGQQALGDPYEDAFEGAHRERRILRGDGEWHVHQPVEINGDPRNIYILDGKNNPVQNRVLVELGNFANKDDLYRIRSPKVRMSYAQVIFTGLTNSLRKK